MKLYKPFRPTVLVITRSLITLGLIGQALESEYIVRIARQSEDPKSLNHGTGPDMVLLDLHEPGNRGHDICRELKSHARPRELPIVFLAFHQSLADETLSEELAVVDHIAMPINPQVLKSRVRVHFAIAKQATALHINNAYLKTEIEKRSYELASMQDTTILALASLAETRDVDTANHLRRTQHYLKVLATSLKSHARFSKYLSEEVIDTLFKCAPLHDIGKVGIPDRILLKPGRYEPAEFEIMKMHPTLGRDAIGNAQKAAGASLEFFEIAKDLVYSHHEKWDGSGYPQGLHGDDIPIPARLMALADVYDALISPRVYKPGMTHQEATEIIVSGKGRHFDPDVVHAFLELENEFQDIAQEFADSSLDLSQKADYLNSALNP